MCQKFDVMETFSFSGMRSFDKKNVCSQTYRNSFMLKPGTKREVTGRTEQVTRRNEQANKT